MSTLHGPQPVAGHHVAAPARLDGWVTPDGNGRPVLVARRRLEGASNWLEDRTGYRVLGKLAQKKQVPVHRHTHWYYLGGMILFLFLLQVATGVLLLFYYRPSAEGAFESVKFLMSEVQFGWLIRSVHAWGANLMIFVIFMHLFSTILLKAYRPPRELTWMTGVALFCVALGLGFTGYLLPWNELAFFATRVGTGIPAAIPIVGPAIGKLLRGGEDITGATLTVSTRCTSSRSLPFGHGPTSRVQRHGMSIPRRSAQGGARRSVPFPTSYGLGRLARLARTSLAASSLPSQCQG
jgi:hypothetical protein